MNYKGRNIDPLSVWDRYVEFPPGIDADKSMFLPLVLCPNPEHDNSRSPAFQINTTAPLVHCFAHCGISGTYDHAVAMIEGYYDDLKVDLGEIDRIRQKSVKERSRAEHDKVARYFRAQRKASKLILRGSTRSKFSRKTSARKTQEKKSQIKIDLNFDTFIPQIGLEYLEGRGITAESIARWGLGWHPDEKRLVIPAHDDRGTLRFLIRRAVKDSQWPKYLYSEGYPKTSLLFGGLQTDLGMVQSRGLILVEGSFDTIKLHQYGLTCAAAILGTGISPEQMRIVMKLRPKRIFLMFDRDTAGVTNISLAAKLLARKYPLFVCRYPRGKFDPAELVKKEAWNSLMRAVPYSLWNRKSRRPESSLTERK
jgi:DNA primase